MKTSTEINSIARIVGEQKAVEMVAKAGFDAWDFSMFAMCWYDWKNQSVIPSAHPLYAGNYLAFARELKNIGLDNGIVCNQSHAPFPVSCPEIRDHLKRAIECTAEAGGDICVIHPDNDKNAEENAEMYQDLLPFAKGCGVRIATENMWNWDKLNDHATFAACSTAEDFCRHIDVIDDPSFVACLDIGHAEMMGEDTSAESMILALGHRLQALHIHDNDRWHDNHQIPFSMDIDFTKIATALKAIGYNGYLTLEADQYMNHFDAHTVFTGVRNLYDSVSKLAAMF